MSRAHTFVCFWDRPRDRRSHLQSRFARRPGGGSPLRSRLAGSHARGSDLRAQSRCRYRGRVWWSCAVRSNTACLLGLNLADGNAKEDHHAATDHESKLPTFHELMLGEEKEPRAHIRKVERAVLKHADTGGWN